MKAFSCSLLLLIVVLAGCGPLKPASAPTATLIPEPIPTSTVAPIVQETTRNINRSIRFEHISLEQGLSQSVVNVIFQDHKGFLWIGTQDGLNRYDGYSFKVYKPESENESSLSDGWITDIVEDQQGYLWIGTRQGGLNRFDPRSGLFTVFRHDPTDSLSLSNNHINALMVDKTGTLWAGTDSDLDQFNSANNTFGHVIGPEDGRSNAVTALYQDKNSFLWIGIKGNGLLRFDVEAGTFKKYKSNIGSSSLSNNNVTSILEDAEGNLWVGTHGGLNRFTESSQTFTRYKTRRRCGRALKSSS